ncbi:MAG: PIG-L family deacetylase [Acidimicrobiia bacterium]
MTDTYDELARSLDALTVPRAAMTIGAHPDDAEFGAGATLARWASLGCEVTMVIVTDGSKGSWDERTDPSALAARRVEEQRNAAEILGATRIVHLGHVDGELVYSPSLREQLAREIRRAAPEVVLTHDPWQRYQLHPDHRATGFGAVDAVVSAREPLALADSGLPAHRVTSLLLWSADEPDHAEEVEDRWFETKVAALLCHSSQSETTMGNAAGSNEERMAFVAKIRSWHEEQGARLGTGPAEVFKRLHP